MVLDKNQCPFALKNTMIKLIDCTRLVHEKIAEITKKEWSKRCQYAHDIEENHMINEAATKPLHQSHELLKVRSVRQSLSQYQE